jgi:hypothetical protein
LVNRLRAEGQFVASSGGDGAGLNAYGYRS